MGQADSVGVEEMDDEHDKCTDAINNLISTQSLTALQNVLVEVCNHFEHEENLLSEHLYHDRDGETGNDGGKQMSNFNLALFLCVCDPH